MRRRFATGPQDFGCRAGDATAFRADPAAAAYDKNFDPSKTVVAYCASGGRSALVAKTLKDMGYANVRNLGGFKGWVDARGTVEKG